jgi:hypothetical protein
MVWMITCWGTWQLYEEQQFQVNGKQRILQSAQSSLSRWCHFPQKLGRTLNDIPEATNSIASIDASDAGV